MTTSVKKQKANPYSEAMRFMHNAEDILKTKAGINGTFYKDEKYVKMACANAYNAVLLAMDGYLKKRNVVIIKKPHSRKNIDDYKRALSEMDEYDMLNYLKHAYNILHLYGYYDGITNIRVIKEGLDSVYHIIEQIK
ncbi:MAG: DUF5618 family protein [Phycisphaerales bacterium]|nr:DUF5618 family protein [Phycisphaerales bacterium]